MNLRPIQTLNSWPLRIEPAHCSVGGSVPAMAKSDRLAADRLRTKRRIAEVTEERAVQLQSYIPQGEAIFKACITAAPACVVCPCLPSPFALRTYIYIYISIYLYIFICIRYLAKSRMEHDHCPRFARSRLPLGNYRYIHI